LAYKPKDIMYNNKVNSNLMSKWPRIDVTYMSPLCHCDINNWVITSEVYLSKYINSEYIQSLMMMLARVW